MADLEALVFVFVGVSCRSISSFLFEGLVNFKDVIAEQILSLEYNVMLLEIILQITANRWNLEELAALLAVEGAPVFADAMDLQAPESNETGEEVFRLICAPQSNWMFSKQRVLILPAGKPVGL